MFDALRQRLAEIQTAHKALPAAAIAVANKLRADVRKGRGKRKRKGSGVPILVVASGDAVRITASDQVQYRARANAEPEAWIDILAKKVTSAARGRG